MNSSSRYSQRAFISAVGTLILSGIASQAAAAPPLPSLPNGDVLKIVTYFDPKQVATVDVTTGVASLDPSTTSATGLPGPKYAEGAGFEESTGKTWILDDGCSLWLLNNDGTTTDQFNLRTTTGLPDLQACFALMLQQDGTAYITGDVTNSNEDSLIRVNLSDGSLVAGSVKDTAEIAGLSRDPSTGIVWASVISSHDASFPQGLYKINLQTGQLDLSSQILRSAYNAEDAWDITFDSSGRLWMLTWGQDATLVSLDPDAANPSSTFISVAVVRSGNVSFASDAMWIPRVGPSPTVTPTPTPTQTSTANPTPTANPTALASTGAEVALLPLASLIAVVAGAGFFALGRGRRTVNHKPGGPRRI